MAEIKINIDEICSNIKALWKEHTKNDDGEYYNVIDDFEIDNGEYDEILKVGINLDLLKKIDEGLIK